jgi:multidrug efflux pump
VLLLLVLGVVFIYAVLAIQFESFVDPLIILLTVPLAAFGALLFLTVFGQSLNIFTKVGLLTLIGLITKHGILLVEFANIQLREGKSSLEAVMKAADLRLRPILMTTCAMVIGSIPLVFSSGAGSESRRAVGLTLVGGLSIGTVLTLTLLPFAYVMIKGVGHKNAEPK